MFLFYRVIMCRSDVNGTLESTFTASPPFELMGSLAHYGPLFLTETLNYPVKMLSLLLVCYPESCHKQRFLSSRRQERLFLMSQWTLGSSHIAVECLSWDQRDLNICLMETGAYTPFGVSSLPRSTSLPRLLIHWMAATHTWKDDPKRAQLAHFP